jgi:hypothetical protein
MELVEECRGHLTGLGVLDRWGSRSSIRIATIATPCRTKELVSTRSIGLATGVEDGIVATGFMLLGSIKEGVNSTRVIVLAGGSTRGDSLACSGGGRSLVRGPRVT